MVSCRTFALQKLSQDSPRDWSLATSKIVAVLTRYLLYSRQRMEPSAACSERLSAPLSFQQLSPDSPYEQDVGDEELVTQFYLRAPVRCSDDRLDEQFADFSIEEVNFDKAKSELVCSNNG